MRHANDGRVQSLTLSDGTASPDRRRRPSGLPIGAALLAAALALLAGCASFPPVEGDPIPDMSGIAGKWVGTVTPGSQGLQDPFYVTIGGDGSLVAAWGVNSGFGRITLSNGRATYQMLPSLQEGTVRLYTDGGKRTLVFTDNWSAFRAQVTPQG